MLSLVQPNDRLNVQEGWVGLVTRGLKSWQQRLVMSFSNYVWTWLRATSQLRSPHCRDTQIGDIELSTNLIGTPQPLNSMRREWLVCMTGMREMWRDAHPGVSQSFFLNGHAALKGREWAQPLTSKLC